MKFVLKCFALSLACALALSPSSAVSQSGPPSTGASDEKTAAEVRTLFLEGHGHQKAGRWADAERAYLAAWAKRKSHDLAANLGLVSMELKKYVQAAECFAFALRNYPAGGSPAKRADIEQSFQQATAQVGSLKITVSADGARVTVNGVDRGRSPLAELVYVEAGAYTVEVQHEGDVTERRNGSVEKGKTQALDVKLVAEKVAPPPSVTASASASASATAISIPTAPAGPRKEVLIGGAVLAGASAITGAILAGLSSANGADAAKQLSSLQLTPDQCAGQEAACKSVRDKLRMQDTFGDAAVGMFVVAGIAGVLTGGYWVLNRSTPARTALVVTPVVIPGAGGVVAKGNW